MTCGIYYIKNPSGKLYIGSSIDVERRWRSYRNLRCKGQPHIHNSLKKHGPSTHDFTLLQECSRSDLLQQEQMYMDFYKPTMNCAAYAASPRLGQKHTAAAKAKISAARTGVPCSDATKAKLSITSKAAMTPARKAKISAFHTGRKHTTETKANISAALTGVTRSPETLAKMSESQKGKVVTQETRDRISAANTGRKADDAERATLRASWTPERRAKIAASNKRRVVSAETRKKMSIAAKAQRARELAAKEGRQ